MALSYYTNWGQLNSENMNGFLHDPEPEQLASEHELLLGLMNDVNFAFPESNTNNIDHLFAEEEDNSFFFYSPPPETTNPPLLPTTFPSTEANYSSISSNSYLFDNFPSEPVFEIEEPFNYNKRLKPCDSLEDILYASDDQFKPPLLNGLLPNTNTNPPPSSCLTFQDYYPPPPPLEIGVPALPEFPTGPPVYNGGSCDQSVKKLSPGNGGTLSAQSIAARQRRRKITEKTQELGKLIPGGQKMNTAEMFQAAYKYIKFLQAQVGILEFMGSASSHEHQPENGEGMLSSVEMEGLLESTLVQEKLYSVEKCLVPEKFVHELCRDEKC